MAFMLPMAIKIVSENRDPLLHPTCQYIQHENERVTKLVDHTRYALERLVRKSVNLFGLTFCEAGTIAGLTIVDVLHTRARYM